MKNILLIFLILFLSCNDNYKKKNKHMEKDSIGTNGYFEVNFLMIYGTFKKVILKDNFSYNIGDSICYPEQVLIQDTIK
jgi:hypothetical protein